MSFMLIGHASRIPPSGGLRIEIADMGAVYDTCTQKPLKCRVGRDEFLPGAWNAAPMIARQGRKSTRGYA
jgi:hypothetical protein